MGGRRVELDPVLDALKPTGRYQMLQALLWFSSHTTGTYFLFGIVFTGQKVGHSCALPPNDTAPFVTSPDNLWINGSEVNYGKCSIDVTTNVSGTLRREETPCVYGMEYDKPREFSVVSEFDLVCGRAPLLGFSQTLLMLGQGIGAVFFTALSDRFGRKCIQVITHVLVIGCSVVIGCAPNYATFAVFKLFGGAVQQGVMLSATTALVESFPGRYRAIMAGFVMSMVFALTTCSYVIWAFVLKDFSWRVLQLASMSVGGAVLLQIVFLKEPMRWLLANGRTGEVLQQLKKAAKLNRRDVSMVLDLFGQMDGAITDKDRSDVIKTDEPDPFDVTTKPAAGEMAALSNSVTYDGKEEADVKQAVLGTERLSYFDLIRRRRLRVNTLCLWVVWCTNSLTYFALFLMSGSLTDDLYLSFFLNVLVEIPACFIFVAIVDRIGRRQTLMMFHCVAAVSLLASGVLLSFKGRSSTDTAAVVTSLIGKLGISGSFNCVFFFTPEIYPTNIRNLAIGTGSMAARVGGMVAPFVGLLADRVVWAPGVVFGTCNLLVVFLIRLLPDSMGRELPQTLNDLEAWYHKDMDKDVKDKDIKDMD